MSTPVGKDSLIERQTVRSVMKLFGYGDVDSVTLEPPLGYWAAGELSRDRPIS